MMLFYNYVERKETCVALELAPEKVYTVAEALRRAGYPVKVNSSNGEFTLEVFDANESLFVANVLDHDAIKYERGVLRLEKGSDFRRGWQRSGNGT
jgi:hypothetical protein